MRSSQIPRRFQNCHPFCEHNSNSLASGTCNATIIKRHNFDSIAYFYLLTLKNRQHGSMLLLPGEGRLRINATGSLFVTYS